MDNHSFGRSYSTWLLKNRALVIIGSLILVFASGSGLPKLTMSSDYQYFFRADDPQRQAFDKLQKVYSRDDSAIIAIKPKEGSVFNKDTLSFVHELTKKSWQVPFSYRVDSLTNFQATKADEDNLTVRDLVRDGDP
ncbi:MAG: RND family transporter, partial [Nitrospinota bacterium]